MERKYTGIILNKKDSNEASRIYTIYTLEEGKIQAIAQGARKARSKLAGNLENFILADIFVAKSKGRGRITGAVAEKVFLNMRNDFESLNCVFRAARLLDKLTGIGEKDEKIFNLFHEFLSAVDKLAGEKTGTGELLLRGFILKLLDCLGYKIEANFCVSCSKKLLEKGNFFSAEKGGFVCGACAGKEERKLSVTANVIKIMRIALNSKIASLEKLKVSEKDMENMKKITEEFVVWVSN